MNILLRCWAAHPSNRVEKERWKGEWIWSRRIKCKAERKCSSGMPYEMVIGDVGHELHPETRAEEGKFMERAPQSQDRKSETVSHAGTSEVRAEGTWAGEVRCKNTQLGVSWKYIGWLGQS